MCVVVIIIYYTCIVNINSVTGINSVACYNYNNASQHKPQQEEDKEEKKKSCCLDVRHICLFGQYP